VPGGKRANLPRKKGEKKKLAHPKRGLGKATRAWERLTKKRDTESASVFPGKKR